MPFKITIGILFGLLVTAISILGSIVYRNSQALNNSAYRLLHTHQALDHVEEISSLSKDIQLESNTFSISGDSSSLDAYFKAKIIESKLKETRKFVLDNKEQAQRIDTLESLLNDLIHFTDSVQYIPKVKTYTEKRLVDRVAMNKLFRIKIRKTIDEIKNEEKRLLIIRERANADSVRSFEKTIILLLTLIGLLLLTTFFSIRYNFNKRIRIQQKLKDASELFGKLFYESPVGMVISRQHDGIILDCNQAYADLIHYTPDHLKGKTAVELKILDNESQRHQSVKGATDQGKASGNEVWLKPKDTDPIWASVFIQSIRVNNEPCLLNAILDLTQHKLAEDETRKALDAQTELSKMKSNFVTMALHEFRTPLTTIQSSGFILARYAAPEDQEKVARQLSRIKSSINQITSILDEFLLLNKIEDGDIELNPEILNLEEYLNVICDNFRAKTKPGQNIVYGHSGETTVHFDKLILGSIVNNLISNAIKYSPENSNIHLTTHVNNRILISIKDNGIGIPKEDQKHLFERFYRASNATNIQGTGIGLHSIKHFVDMMNGSIEVKSEVDNGTEFKITLDNP